MIETEVTYTDSDYQRATSFVSRDVNKIYAAFFVMAGMGLGLIFYLRLEWWWMPVILVIVIFLYAMIVLSQRFSIARQLKEIPDAYGPYGWKIDTEGIQISGPLSTTAIKWPAIIKARETDVDFFFYQAPKFARFLPKRALTAQQVVDARQLITECVRARVKLLNG